MPEPVRDTVLYLLRFAWTLSLVQKSVRNDCSDLPTAQHCVQLLLGKKSLFDGQGKDASYLRFVLGVLHCIAVRPREAFLPEDPTVEELERYKVLLYAGIPPLCREGPAYRYTLENLYRLESTAATMFQFGLLPESNTFGCSVHRLPKPPVGRLALFTPRDRVYVKCATTRVYKLGHFWIGPFLDRVLFSCGDGPVQSLPLSAITVGCRAPMKHSASWTRRRRRCWSTSGSRSRAAACPSSARRSSSRSTWCCARASSGTSC